MLRNYIITALRNLVRQKIYSFINILGLSIGLACFILIMLWVSDELGYDRFHENANHLYRVYEKQYYSGGEEFKVFATPEPLAVALEETFPEIVSATRLNALWFKLTLRYGEKIYNETGGYATDPATFGMFTFPFIAGDPKTALSQPYSMVLTESMAKKYFENEDPMGKTITVNNQYTFMVTGIMKDVPHNSHVRFDYLVPFDFILELWDSPRGQWGRNSYRTYIQVQEGVSQEVVEKKILNFIQKHLEGSSPELYLHPLVESHLYSIWGGGLIQYVKIFSVVALFVLIIACINFMNLTTAHSGQRAREVGIRKVAGSKKRNLILQFYGESILLTLIALIFAIIIVQLLLPVFNNLAGKEINFRFYEWKMLYVLLGITFFTGLLSGSYPAFFLSSFNTVEVLKGTGRTGSPFFRRFLVVLQFAISVALIICTLVVYKQRHYIRFKDLGFDKNNILYFSMRDIKSKYVPMKQALMSLPGVTNVTATNRVPVTMTNSGSNVDWDGKDPSLQILFQYIFIDFDYFETLKMNMFDGRTFSIELKEWGLRILWENDCPCGEMRVP
ncbi:hypothetical protein ES708_08546 [subsurface metagenome]